MGSISLNGINKSFGSTEVLKDINLDIKDGEFLILIGPSGCGKSTLMNLIAGLEDLTGGEIIIDGKDVSEESPKDRDIAMVFQSYALYPTMNVARNICFGLEMSKMPKNEQEVIFGGGGENAMTVLKSRAISGNPPTAAQIKGPSIQEWGDLGFLADINGVAEKNNWDDLLPAVVADVMKHEGKYVAAPVNVHRVNWMWSNPEVFRAAGATIPTTWDDFMVQAKKLQDAGYVALAHGGQPWQDATVFEAVVLGVGGADYYNKAFVEMDRCWWWMGWMCKRYWRGFS